jgi:hypothetical protein
MKSEEMKNTTALATVRKQNVVDLDGFSDFTNECEGDSDDVNMSSRVIQGTKLKFIDPRWLIDGQDVTGKQLTLIGVRNVVNKWSHDNKPLVTEILQPGQRFPDFKKLNDEAPRSEWRTSFGKETGPWSGQHCLYFIDDNYNPYTWASPITMTGSSIAVGEIVDHVNRVRKFREPDVYVVVELSHCFFKTGYGAKERPHLPAKALVKLKSNRMGALPAPDATVLTDSSTASPPQQGAPADAQTVEPITLAEEMNDKIKY